MYYDIGFLSSICDAIQHIPHEDASDDAKEWFDEILRMANKGMDELLDEVLNDNDNSSNLVLDELHNTNQGEILSCYITHFGSDETFHHKLTDRLLELVKEREKVIHPPIDPYLLRHLIKENHDAWPNNGKKPTTTQKVHLWGTSY